MILTKEIEIKTTNKNIGHYIKMGYNVSSGDLIKISPEQLPISSKNIIRVECDVCHNVYDILYHSYYRNIKNGEYHCKKCSSIRGKETSMVLYGVNHPLKNELIKNKVKNTNLLKYGTEYPSQSDEIKNKIKNTCLDKYGETSYMKTDDFKKDSLKTNLNKYGVKYAIQNRDIKEKVIKTCFNRYGVSSPLKLEDIKNKILETKKLKYGDENYNNRIKYKKTCLEIFGFENPMLNLDIQDKLKKSMNKKYGFDFATQNEIIFKKMLKNGYKINKYEDLYYQGTYELDFLEKYYHIGIKRCESIKYQYENIEHIYFPDFYFEKLNLIIEIKSSKWYQEHLDKNLAKQNACREQGYNFIFIIDKNYDTFDKLIKHIVYDKDHSWQYDIRLNSTDEFIPENDNLKISDFAFEYIPDTNKKECEEIKNFIEKYEWLGKMPNRPTHRFVAKYNNKLSGVVIMATPNTFSKLLGDDTNKIEKLISRGACASWTPKNLASALIMWSIKWMTKNTPFRIFTAYSDTEAKELGTIYQACNFKYIGKKFGSNYVYFDINKPNLGWFSNRNFHRRSMYKKTAKKLNIEITWDKVSEIPFDIKTTLNNEIGKYIKSCIKRETSYKHKYVYILGENNRETKQLVKLFEENNPKLLNLVYPKNR